MTTAIVVTRSGGGDDHVVAATPPTSTSTTSHSTAPSQTASVADAAHSGYLRLWPFAGRADAAVWQAAYRSGGHQPWHVDPGATALSFTQGYLGYTNIDTVIDVATSGQQSWVSVGFDNPNRQPVTSAVLHLVRLGTGTDAPWEVVGTRDTTLTLSTPGYGSTVRSPATVGGRITGVDESPRVQVHQLDQQDAIGRTDGVPAGGDRAQWTVQVPFSAATGDTLTIAVSTGGHVADVERFAITGVRS
ncbi:MAG TPA: hypothetical protein VFX16_13800 [Pseudonocardiaceae bacterium]|nr:hypothetical protein [Pseudonocardiaceae bacterium]